MRTCFLLERFCQELHDDVIEVATTDASVTHSSEHPHVLLDEVHYCHAVALIKKSSEKARERMRIRIMIRIMNRGRVRVSETVIEKKGNQGYGG